MKLEVGPVSAPDLAKAVSEIKDGAVDIAAVPEVPPDDAESQAGIREQPQPDIFCVGIPIVLGRFSGDQLRKAADAAQRYGSGTLRLTSGRVLLFPDIHKDKVANLLEGLQTVGLGLNVPPLLRGASACVGQKLLAKEIIEYLQAAVPLREPFRIHLCGCSPDCGCTPTGDILLKRSAAETEEAFDLFIGGRHFVLGGVPASELKTRLEQLIAGYKKRRKKGEPFGDFCARVGDEEIVRFLTPVAVSADDPETI